MNFKSRRFLSLLLLPLTFVGVVGAFQYAEAKSAIPANPIASPCAGTPKEIRNWLELKMNSLDLTHLTLNERLKFNEQERASRAAAAETVWLAYFDGSLNSEGLFECLERESVAVQGSFSDSVNALFYRKTIERLQDAHTPVLRQIAELLKMRNDSGGLPLFHLLGEKGQGTPAPFSAGFHRSGRSIYMSFALISPDEWFLIFLHEIAHGLDRKMQTAVTTYSDRKLIEQVTGSSHRLQTSADFSDTDRAALRRWLEAGLSRGLWAEYRAWSVSFAAYADGIEEGLWKEIPWMERLLEDRHPDEGLRSFVYRILDARSKDPAVEGIFSLPLVRAELQAIRIEALAGKLPPLGDFEFIP